MKPKNYELIAQYLRRMFLRHVVIDCPTFVRELKNVLNNSEAKRLFNYYLDTEKILNYEYNRHNSCFYRWDGKIHQEHFSVDAVRDIFLNYNIATRKGRNKGSNNNVSIAAMAVSKEETKIEENQPATITLNDFSNQELIIELLKRGIIDSIQVKVK